MTKKILSFGGGVNSTALLFKFYNDIDIVIFADTGAEIPETYEYIENIIKPFCDSKGIRFITVTRRIIVSHFPRVAREQTLYEHSYYNKIFPFATRKDCTDKFKLRPVLEWLKNNTDMDIIVYVGIASDEAHRVREGKHYVVEYPLVDHNISREKCNEIIIKSGYPLPLKSGCYFCPSAPVPFYSWLWEHHPDLAKRVSELEKNNKRYPEVHIKHKPIEEFNKPSKKKFDRKGYNATFEPEGEYCSMCYT